MVKRKILIVEDEALVAQELKVTLHAQGYDVSVAESGEKAMEQTGATVPDLVLLDIMLPGALDGIAAGEHFGSRDVPIIYMTGYSDGRQFDRARNTEPLAYLSKPLRMSELNRAIELALSNRSREQERERERERHANQLRESEERLRIALNAARMGTWRWDLRTDIDIIDDSLQKLFGLGPGRTIRTVDDFYAIVHPDEREKVIEAFARTLRDGTHLDTEFRVVWADGSEHWLIDQGEVTQDEEGKPIYLSGACVDITERRRASDALRESETRFRFYASHVRDYALLQLDTEGRIVDWNAGAERVLGYGEAEILGQPAALLFTPEDVAHAAPEKELENARRTGRSIDERWHIRKDGSQFWASGVLTSMLDEKGRLQGFAKVMRDETERRRSDEQLRDSLQEKEVLLQEIHHRVKNNLQVISSLLRLQSEHISDEQTLALFDQARNRVQAIGGIHELLYQSPDLARVDFGAYIRRLTKDLLAFYEIGQERVRCDIEVTNTSLDIGQAIPCGLIINELVTNVLKHAFPPGRNGKLQVALDCVVGRCLLTFKDDGVGLPETFDWQQAESLGLQIVQVLTAQLDGTVRVDRLDPGTRFEISFPLRGK